MGMLSLILAGAGAVCLMLSARGLAVLAFAAAAGVWLVPNLGGGGPPGFALAAEATPAPTARFRAVDGTPRTLADFRGRVVLLNIWATWCGPCRSEMASLDRLQALHGADGLEVLAVSVDRDGLNKVRRFYQNTGIRNLKVYVDSDRGTAAAFGARAIPMTVLIDREGNMVGSLVGAAEWDSSSARELIRRYLEG
jgi:thiol-disulfide isomerase/thioredoxin